MIGASEFHPFPFIRSPKEKTLGTDGGELSLLPLRSNGSRSKGTQGTIGNRWERMTPAAAHPRHPATPATPQEAAHHDHDA